MRREVKPEPVPPPKEWKIRNPCRFDELKRGKFGVYVKNSEKYKEVSKEKYKIK